MLNNPAIWGGLAGMLLTAPLIAVFYAGYALAGLSFVPFDIFDWTARMLPGPVVTFGIETMVRIIQVLNLGATSATAKMAEQVMAVAGFLIAGTISGAILFAILHVSERRFAPAIGLLIGGLMGVGVLLIDRGVGLTAVNSVANALWILTLFVAWGAAMGWSYLHLAADERVLAASDGRAIGRRTFALSLAGSAAAVTVLGASVGQAVRRRERAAATRRKFWADSNPLPNADASVKPAPGTRPELTPVADHYRIDINTAPPVIAEASWRLKIGGLLEQPLAFTLAELRGFEQSHQFITLSCISNLVGGDLIGTTRWTGVSLNRLLPQLKLKPNATHLKVRSADGFYEVVALETIRGDDRAMLTYAWDGAPLTAAHGFPLRIYIPDRYGMKQPKWIEAIDATDHWEPGYWVARGWDREARMKTTSVIDTIAVDMMIGQAGQGALVPVGGIAHAGVRGVSRVEISVDGGGWQAAQLRTPLSGQTWVIWRYDWPSQKGKHTFAVRCFDGLGEAQIAQEAPPHPSGATGLHIRSVML